MVRLLEVVKRIKDEFEVLPRRCLVKESFSKLGRYCQLSKNYEFLPKVSLIYGRMLLWHG